MELLLLSRIHSCLCRWQNPPVHPCSVEGSWEAGSSGCPAGGSAVTIRQWSFSPSPASCSRHRPARLPKGREVLGSGESQWVQAGALSTFQPRSWQVSFPTRSCKSSNKSRVSSGVSVTPTSPSTLTLTPPPPSLSSTPSPCVQALRGVSERDSEPRLPHQSPHPRSRTRPGVSKRSRARAASANPHLRRWPDATARGCLAVTERPGCLSGA